MRKLTETDVKQLAKGYWGDYFNWRIHPKAKPAFVVGVTVLVTATVLAIAAAPTSTVPDDVALAQVNPIPFAVIATSILVIVAALLWGFFVYSRERDDFIDQAVQRWVKAGTLPNRDTVIDFVNKGG